MERFAILFIFKFGAFVLLIGQCAAGALARFPSAHLENFRALSHLYISISMRRIPRPSRAIDPSTVLHSAVRPRISPPSCHCIRTSTAAFSSTPSNGFLLPAKQDKKKHQQFVRRWQKRLLGDSEPIGAHVDPYDPTSPVRIAPEEQGEYEEVLDEEGGKNEVLQQGRLKGLEADTYIPVEESGRSRPGADLLHVGGEEWLQQKVEADMAREYEKLTMRTYTPMTLGMANEIESLTGTPYTLRDDNLMMAQATHDVTARPYTSYNFGLHRKLTRPEDLRARFAQAVAEVYALKEADLDLNLAKLPNRGIYDVPRWVKDIKLQKVKSGGLTLRYPGNKSAKDFLEAMQSAPEWESAAVEGDELLVEGAEDLVEPVLPADALPTMDPATPAFKREAVVKIDPEKKPFDFMSNRPVPRTKPAEPTKVEEVLEVEIPTAEPVDSTPSRRVLQPVADHLTGSPIPKPPNKSTPSKIQLEEVQWRHAPIDNNAIKFALFKRVFQLTGIRISDPHLTSSTTIGQLYDHVYEAAKPQPTSLYSAIHIEGANARRRAKRSDNPNPSRSQRRADLGDLITAGNVQLRKNRPTKMEIRTKTGQAKSITRALRERGLLTNSELDTRRDSPLKDKIGLIEGTRDIPDFGKPLSSKSVNYLIEHRKKDAKKQEAAEVEKMGQRWGVRIPKT
ncbi:hypothetical protein HBI62_070740 [Parastagonospora nodorum]|nr:hypothetical protein HBH47_149850 [Parastagonospora nodorum]KAH5232328.1 hypothetical protein HBI62_070740 [Parastagonospora nodorum]KAH6163774.1 hypothetical protein HBI63_037640 [Parastagonospora nodorum]KAH6183508.1 hypothetical protein HBI61_070790 [Parastagonospora nodorum]